MWPYNNDVPLDSGKKKPRKKRVFDGDCPSDSPRRPLLDPSKLQRGALREAALRYLDRQDGAVEQVRRSLRRRVHRYGNDELRTQAHQDIELVLDHLVEARLLDDLRLALALALNCRRKGASENKVRQKLHSRGLSAEHIALAIESLPLESGLDEESCASIYAKKRRLRERFDLSDGKERQKALAALARQGFSFEVAKSALGL